MTFDSTTHIIPVSDEEARELLRLDMILGGGPASASKQAFRAQCTQTAAMCVDVWKSDCPRDEVPLGDGTTLTYRPEMGTFMLVVR